jgi:hypothetical protein
MRFATLCGGAIGRRSESVLKFERVCQMTLIVKSGRESDLAKRFVGTAQLCGGVVQAQAPDVFAHGAVAIPSKHFRQMRGMQAGRFGNSGQTDLAAKRACMKSRASRTWRDPVACREPAFRRIACASNSRVSASIAIGEASSLQRNSW